MASNTSSPELKVAIAGLGSIGKVVADRLLHGIEGLRLVAVGARRPDNAREFLAARDGAQVAVTDLAHLPELADVIVEALPAKAFDEIAEPALRAGRTLMVVSVGQLLGRERLFDVARQSNGRIIVPTGALLGLDAVQAAAQGQIHSVRMTTRKPPAGLVGAPHLVRNNINLDGLTAPLRIFSGTAREAVVGFPANVNVVAALSLAGVGPDRTTIEIWADPSADRNQHSIEVDSDSASFSMEIRNIPSADNPKTGKITALSVVAALRKLGSSVRIGT